MKIKISFCALVWTTALWAHAIELRVQQALPAVVVYTTYTGSVPVIYATVLVYAPSSQEAEYQNGRTDANGVFSFVPDREGEWRFLVDDGMGHREEIPITVSADLTGGFHSPAHTPMSMESKLITVLALSVGLAGFLYGLKARPH